MVATQLSRPCPLYLKVSSLHRRMARCAGIPRKGHQQPQGTPAARDGVLVESDRRFSFREMTFLFVDMAGCRELDLVTIPFIWTTAGPLSYVRRAPRVASSTGPSARSSRVVVFLVAGGSQLCPQSCSLWVCNRHLNSHTRASHFARRSGGWSQHDCASDGCACDHGPRGHDHAEIFC